MGKRLWVERNKDGSWDAFSEDGAHIKFGKGRGQFTAGLSDEDADKLKERVTRHIDKGCTVKHTYVEPTPVRMNVTVKH